MLHGLSRLVAVLLIFLHISSISHQDLYRLYRIHMDPYFSEVIAWALWTLIQIHRRIKQAAGPLGRSVEAINIFRWTHSDQPAMPRKCRTHVAKYSKQRARANERLVTVLAADTQQDLSWDFGTPKGWLMVITKDVKGPAKKVKAITTSNDIKRRGSTRRICQDCRILTDIVRL